MKLKNVRNHQWGRKLSILVLRGLVYIVPSDTLAARFNFILANLCQDDGKVNCAKLAFGRAVALGKAVSERYVVDERSKWVYADYLRKSGFFKLNVLKDFNGALKEITDTVRIVEAVRGRYATKSDDVPNTVYRVLANSYAALGNYYYDTKDIPQAKQCFMTAINFADHAGYYERAITLDGDLGNIYIEQKKWHDARRILIWANEKARRYYHHAAPSSYMRLARLYMLLESPFFDPKQALLYAEAALEWAKKARWPKEVKEAKSLTKEIRSQFDLE